MPLSARAIAAKDALTNQAHLIRRLYPILLPPWLCLNMAWADSTPLLSMRTLTSPIADQAEL